MSDTTAGSGIAETVAALQANPAESALLFDIDGTLAPIRPDPEDVAVPGETQKLLRDLALRYALIACVTGRRSLDARRIVGVEELIYAGNHGLELLRPGAWDAEIDPAVAGGAGRARDFVLGLDAAEVSAVGFRVESKGPIQALHWREADDPDAAEAEARRIAHAAERANLVPHWGRRVLEIRPVAGIDKGTAVDRLVGEHHPRQALFGGDDRGDLAAFATLDRLVETGRLRFAALVGVLSDEAPPELTEWADVVVQGPEGFLEVLRELARPGR